MAEKYIGALIQVPVEKFIKVQHGNCGGWFRAGKEIKEHICSRYYE